MSLFVKKKSYAKRIMIFDWYNLMYRCVHPIILKYPEDNDKFHLTTHQIIESFFYTIKEYTPDEVVIAIDSKDSWRYEIFPSYKSARKARKTKIALNTDKFIPVMEDVLKRMEGYFTNIKFIKEPRCEADDIIAVITKDQADGNNEIIIVSSDSDMFQLTAIPRVRHYDPMRRQFREECDPTVALEVKIIGGDTSDSIPNVRKGTGPVAIQKILEEGLVPYMEAVIEKDSIKLKKSLAKDPSVEPSDIDGLVKTYKDDELLKVFHNYQRNKTLISFSEIPTDIEQRILYRVRSKETCPIDGSKTMKFFISLKLSGLMADWATKFVSVKNVGMQ